VNVLLQREERPEGGWLARVTIDNTGKLNSLNRALMGEIIETVAAFASDPQLRLAILTGAGGRAFVGGADIGQIAALDHTSARDFITMVHRCCDAFRRLPVPVIARIDGWTLGAGLELAAPAISGSPASAARSACRRFGSAFLRWSRRRYCQSSSVKAEPAGCC